MVRTPRLVRRRFDRFNRLYWDGKLDPPNIIVIPAGMAGRLMNLCADWGAYGMVEGTPTIELRAIAAYVHETYFNANLLHEMIHHAVGATHHHRSRKYRAEIQRLSGLGALREVL